MLKKLSLIGLCLTLLALVSVPLVTTAYAQEPANEELLGSSVGGLNLAQARAEYERGWNTSSFANRLPIFRRLAEQGYGPAQHWMGVAYRLAENQATAQSWWRKAAQTLPQQAEAGDHWAQSDLGLMYYLGRGGLTSSTATACSWWRKAAANGNERAKSFVNNRC